MLHCFDCDVAVVARRLHNERFQQEEEARRDERWRVCERVLFVVASTSSQLSFHEFDATQPGQKCGDASETETGNLSPKVSAGSPLVG